MRTIKIYGVPSHQEIERTSGVDFARIIQPCKYLDGYIYEGVKFKVDIFNIHQKISWLDVAENYDAVFLNYIANSWQFAAMGAFARANERKIILDIDDGLWHIKADNPAYGVYKPGSTAIRHFNAICKEVDLITTTSNYLKNVIMTNTGKSSKDVKVRDNLIDLTMYDNFPEFKDDGVINIYHFGSTSHFNDLLEPEFMKGINKIMAEYPNVNFKTVGAFLPAYRERWGCRYYNLFGHQDIYKWIKEKSRELLSDADIIVTPLTDDIYNRCKSGIKYLEASSYKKPGVYQNLKQYAQYISNGNNGYLAQNSQDWYSSIKKLIDDKMHRKQVAQEAYNTIQKYTIQKNIVYYADMFKKLLTK